jgi:Dolichyl-phosphate-mannose-protein mannosyltransferase
MKRDFNRWEIIFVGVVFTAGLALRLRLALLTYLNPDEALHALWAFGTWADTLRNSPADTHPPLLLFITHAVSLISRTELALRLVPVLAGSLFPLLLFAWLRRLAGRMAAMAALFLLTLAPHLITISAQVRSYTLAFLFLSASLVMLEEALEDDRWSTMAVYSAFLWLCILSDYSMAWFAGAVGFYALVRLRGSSARVKVTWTAGQLGALLLYGLLFAIQVRNATASRWQDVASGWLRGGFPQPGKMLTFPFVGTLKQFAYLLASVPIGGLALVLFAVAVFWLWTGRTKIEPSKARALAALLVLPFVLAIAGAYAHQFPYGRSRHTLVIGLFGATGIAIFIEELPRRASLALLWGALFLTPLWHWVADWDEQDIGADRNQKELILQCLDYMRAAIPPGTLVFTERETLFVLAYYEGYNELPYQPASRQFSETVLGGRWRVATMNYKYITRDAYKAGLAAFRRQYGLGEREPVWVLDGGWDVVSVPPDERRPFTKAVRVFQTAAR